MLSDRTVRRLHASAGAERWEVSTEAFRRALEASAAKALHGHDADVTAVDAYVSGLRLEDLALACACADGHEEAWRHFILTYRPQLYRAADALDPSGASRELADALYADLFGNADATGQRQSLFRYFHGRSSLATWLRAVLSQRYIDRLRAARRTDPLPDDESPQAVVAPEDAPQPERARYLTFMQQALDVAVAALLPKDRLRLGCYYAQQMRLAQVGRLLGEHEATVSRQLARTRAMLRASVEAYLVDRARLGPAAVAECFAVVAEDPGPLNLGAWFDESHATGAGKKDAADRSSEGRTS